LNVILIGKGEQKKRWKAVAMVYFKILFKELNGGIEGNFIPSGWVTKCIYFYRTTRRYISGESTLHSRRYENLKSNKILII
jgi:hypothetical protein